MACGVGEFAADHSQSIKQLAIDNRYLSISQGYSNRAIRERIWLLIRRGSDNGDNCKTSPQTTGVLGVVMGVKQPRGGGADSLTRVVDLSGLNALEALR